MAAGGELSESKHRFPTDYVLILMSFCLYRNLMLMYVCVHVCIGAATFAVCFCVSVCVYVCMFARACVGAMWEESFS